MLDFIVPAWRVSRLQDRMRLSWMARMPTPVSPRAPDQRWTAARLEPASPFPGLCQGPRSGMVRVTPKKADTALSGNFGKLWLDLSAGVRYPPVGPFKGHAVPFV